MPLWIVTVEKYYPPAGEYWTNVYHLNAASGEDASAAAAAFRDAELPLYHPGVTLTKVRISSAIEEDEAHNTWAYNAAGTRTGVTSDMLPLFNVARVDFTVAWQRPSRKYLRAVLVEAESTFTSLAAGLVSVLDAYGTAVRAITGICDEHGNTFTGHSVWPAPAMRQLRRGSKKKLTP